MNLRQSGLALAAILTGASLLGGCTAVGGAKSTSSAPAPSVSLVPSVEPTVSDAPSAAASAESSPSESASATTSPSVTLGMPAPAPSDAASAGPEQSAPSAGPESLPVSTASATPGLVSAVTGQATALGLGQAFRSDGWTTGDYQAAGATTKAPAFAATVNCDATPAEIEYRFAPTTGSLTLGVAQDVLSPSSDNTVVFKVLADGKVVSEKTVPFRQPATVQVPLSGVTVVKIQAATKGTCSVSSTALITRATVQG